MHESITVFVTDDSAPARAVRDTIRAWAEVGLVVPSVWVSPAGVTRSAGAPTHVMATEVSAAGERSADLFVLTGVRRLDTCRVVLTQLVTTGAYDLDMIAVGDLGDEVSQLLRAALPHENEARGAHGTELMAMNVVIPSSGLSDVPRAVLRRGWDLNAVVAAEDRPDFDRGSVYVRHPGNYVGHAAAALAGLGGLWSGVGEGAVDHLRVDSTTVEDDVVVCRTAVRAVLGEDLPLAVTATATDTVRADELGPARYLRWARNARDVQAVVDEAAGSVLQREPWRSTPSTEGEDPVRGHRAPRAALGEAAAANARMFALGAQWVVGRGREMVEDAATGLLVGHGADYTVRLRPATPASLEAAARGQLQRTGETRRGFMLEREASGATAPPAGTWDELRQLSFSLLDGSTRPSWSHERSTEVTELLPPAAVVASPWDELGDGQGGRVRSYDLGTARDLLQRSQDRVAELDRAVEQLERDLASCRDPSDTQLDDAEKGAPLEGQLVTTRAARQAAVAYRDGIEAWLRRREKSMLGLVVTHTDRLRQQATSRAESAREAALDDNPPSTTDLRRAQRGLIAGWVLLVLAPLAVTGVGYWLYTVRGWGWADLASVAASGLPLWLVAAVLINHRYYRACRRYAWTLSTAIAQRRRSTEVYVASRKETNRLALLQRTLLDWADILGALVHRTWETPEPDAASLSAETLATLPAAAAVAHASSAEALTSWHLAQAVERLCPRGWVAVAFDEVLGLPDLEVFSPGGGVSAVIDGDVVEAESSARETMRRLLLTGEAARHLSVQAVQRLRQDIRDEKLVLPDRTVRRSGPYSDGALVSDVDYLTSMFGAPIPFANDLWTDAGLQRLRHLPAEGSVWTKAAFLPSVVLPDLRAREADGDVAMRVDTSRRCRPDDLLLFAPGLPWCQDPAMAPPRQSRGEASSPEPWN